MVEILHNNYQIPIYSIEDQDNIIKIIHSKEFNDIYSFYASQIPAGSRLEQLPDYEKRMGFYLYYTGQDQFLSQVNNLLYKKHMPTIQEFLKDDAYMGNSYAIIYPYWRDVLAKIFDPSNQYFECVFRGSIGSGKSTIARRGLIYSLYRICCLRSPHKLFNIAPDTVLSALMISVTLQQAQDTALKPVLEMIRNSPCFHEVRKMTSFDAFGPGDPVPFCRQGNGIRFPNNVYLSVGSNINHIIGYSVFGSIFDEAEEKDSTEAFKLYTGLRERIRSRFLNSSLIYCALISSSKSKSGMVWEYIRKIKPDDPETLLLDPSIWEVKGDALGLSGKKFWIYIGTKTHPSKVLPAEYNDVPLEQLNYVPPAGCELLEVPIEYKREFENNIEAAIQNIAGRTTDTSDRPFDDLSKLGDCPQLLPEVHLEAPLGDQIPLIDKLPKELFQETTVGPRLARYPSAPRFCFTGDTRVDLLNGESKTFKELTQDLEKGQVNYVYSWDTHKNEWCAGKIIDVGITKYVSEIAEVELDSGEKIRCTPDHKFLLKNGEYKPVSDIGSDESLLAIYKKKSKKISYKKKSYEEVLNPISGNWVKTHKFSAKFYNENLDNAKMLAKELKTKVIIHHKDSDASNNNPDNLMFLESNEHLMLHSNKDINQLSQLWQISDFRKMMTFICSENGKVNGKISMSANWKDKEFIEKMRIVNANNGRKNITKYNKSEEHKKRASQLGKEGKIGVKRFSKELLQFGNLQCRRNIIKKNIEYLQTLCLPLTKSNWNENRYCKNVPLWDKVLSLNDKDFGDLKQNFILNHKIRSIKIIKMKEPIPVYDLTVENSSNTHNFALTAGVVVSNCHVDLASQSSSQAGYSLWHKEYIVNEYGEHVTVFVADFISWISAPNRIDHDAIKQLSLDLRDKAGVYIKTISYDQFQCLTGDTEIVMTRAHPMTIKEIYESFEKEYWIPRVLTYNPTTHEYKEAKVVAARCSGQKRLAIIKLSNKKVVKCSDDHRFLLENGEYVHARDLKKWDRLRSNPFKKNDRCEITGVYVENVSISNRTEEMYDISIENGCEPNFLLSAGVFVHNSEYVRQSLQQNHEFENVKYQSVDRDITAYLNFAQWMVTGRIKIGDCPYLREQLGYIGVVDKKLLTTHKKDMADSCLSYDTKIFLLSGKVLTVEELYNSDVSHEWILACDCETKQLRPVHIERVLEKHIPETLIQFTLSNGKTFACTDDHLILMKNGTYKRADEIEQFEEFMPFNYYHELNYHDRYRKVVNPFRKTSKFLYKIVSQELLSNAIQEAKNRAVVDGSKFTVIHHKSHNKNDDRPENLVPLTNIEHTNLHAMTGREIKAFHDRTVLKRQRSKIINEGLALMKQVNPEGYRRYLLKHDIADQLAEKKAKVENLSVYATQITHIENDKPVYDIVLNSIHNFALDCNIFVHNCVGAVNNAYLDTSPVEFPFVNTKTQEVKSEDSFIFDPKTQEVIEI